MNEDMNQNNYQEPTPIIKQEVKEEFSQEPKKNNSTKQKRFS